MNFHTEAPYINPTLKRRFLARKRTARGLCENSQRTSCTRLHPKPAPPCSDSTGKWLGNEFPNDFQYWSAALMNLHTEAPCSNPTLKRRFLARKQTAKGLCGNSQRTLRYRCPNRKPLPPGSDSNKEKDFAEKIKATSRPDWKPTKPRPLPVPPAAARLAKVIHFSQPEKPPGRRGFSVMRWLLL